MKKLEMPPVSLCKIHAVGLLRSKIADVHGIEVHDVRSDLKICLSSETFPIFIAITPET